MEDNFFYDIVLVSAYIHMNQPQAYICPLPLEPTPPNPPPFLPSHPSRLSQKTSLSSLPHTANPHWLSILHGGLVTISLTLASPWTVAWLGTWQWDIAPRLSLSSFSVKPPALSSVRTFPSHLDTPCLSATVCHISAVTSPRDTAFVSGGLLSP